MRSLIMLCLWCFCATGAVFPLAVQAAPGTAPEAFFRARVQPVLEQRCVVCHACYDAPCQLKLSSPEGLARGASKALVYDGTRLRAIAPTRLGVDAHSPEAWRELGFFPVMGEPWQPQPSLAALPGLRLPELPDISLPKLPLPKLSLPTVTLPALPLLSVAERALAEGPDLGMIRAAEGDDPVTSDASGILRRLLLLKQAHPLPAGAVLDERYTLGLDREQTCPSPDEMGKFEKRHPQWGMPYGLPALAADEHDVLMRWLDAGAPTAGKTALAANYSALVDEWENFLNADSLKQQLASRYIYEHLFLAHLHFDATPVTGQAREFFRMVRSRTPPGQPIDIIATRRPFDDPGVTRVYYRLQRDEETVIAKTLMPYLIDRAQLERMKTLFVTPDYTVSRLPGYDPATSANPFLTFRDLPVGSRYRMMLDHAQYTIMGFIKGPVCRGQVALNVIDDHFWVFFLDPDEQDSAALADFLANNGKYMGIPGSEETRGAGMATAWVKYSLKQRKYLEARTASLSDFFSTGGKVTLNMIWDGDGHNRNAAVTVFRHFDSSSVEQGLLGQAPKTAWVISYPLLERLHYLLVANFDVFDNIGHHLDTRLYMDFLRMEGEFNFLSLLPREERKRLRDYWYRDAHMDVHDYIFKPALHFHQATDIDYVGDNPQQELYDLLKTRLATVLNRRHDIDHRPAPFNQGVALQRLNLVHGKTATLFPELSMILVEGDQHEDQLYTLIRNSGHSNIASLINEDDNRLPEEDYLTLLKGVVGAYPGIFWRVPEGRLHQFVNQAASLSNEADYRVLLDRYAVRRTSPGFWAFSDRVHALYQSENPLEAGLLDYSRLENR